MRRAVALGALCLAAMPASAAPRVTSDSDCPSAAEVMTRLGGLWSADNPVSVAAHVRIQGGQMAVELASESEPATSRMLPAEPDCGSRAQAAALVIAAWLDGMPADPLGRVDSVAALSVEPPSLRAPVTQTPLPAQSRASLGIGGFASLDGRGAGAALSGEAAWTRLAGRFGLAAALGCGQRVRPEPHRTGRVLGSHGRAPAGAHGRKQVGLLGRAAHTTVASRAEHP